MADMPLADPRQEPPASADDAGLSALERARARKRAYRLAHPDRVAASSRRWREANPERIRELNRRWKDENPDRHRQLNRESMRRAYARRRAATEELRQADDKRVRKNEASRRWKERHPEQVREYHRDWVAANRDKVAEYRARYVKNHREELNARATAWRDSAPEKMKRARKAWADRNKDRVAEIQLKRRDDPEKYRADLARNAAAARLRKRLARAGLPPKQVHRATAGERRLNAAAAMEYFADPTLPEKLRQFTVFTVSLTDLVLANGDRMREFAEAYVTTRVRMGLPPVDAEQVMYARAAQIVADSMKRSDLLTGREVAAAVRSAKSAAAAEHEHALTDLTRAVEAHLREHRARLTEDAHLENTARITRGKPPLPVELLIVRGAIEELSDGAGSVQLNQARADRVLREMKSVPMRPGVPREPARPAVSDVRQR